MARWKWLLLQGVTPLFTLVRHISIHKCQESIMEHRQRRAHRILPATVLPELPGLFSVCALGKAITDNTKKDVYVNTKYM